MAAFTEWLQYLFKRKGFWYFSCARPDRKYNDIYTADIHGQKSPVKTLCPSIKKNCFTGDLWVICRIRSEVFKINRS